MASIQPITMITGIKYEQSLLKIFNNITFAYDANWEYQQGNPTYPLSFFYVKEMSEQMSSDVSSKPLLFYNTGVSVNTVHGGLMNIIADNVITKPKEYRLDIYIPSNSSTFINNSYSLNQVAEIQNFLFTQGTEVSTSLSSTSRIVNTSLGILKMLLKALYGTSISASSILDTFLGQKDFNKASLENMWANRRIIKLKLWNGWKFKYLIIKSLDITKHGEDGEFYEATMICQEVPIMTFRKQSLLSSLSFMSKISAWSGKLIKSSVDIFIKAMTAVAGE